MCLAPFPIALTLSVWLVKYVGVQWVSQMIVNLLFLWLKIQGPSSLEKSRGANTSASSMFGTVG